MREHGSSNASINRDLSMGKESLAGEAVAEKEKQETKKYKRVHGKKIQLPHGFKETGFQTIQLRLSQVNPQY
jgi:hypothetical protein